MRRSKLIATKSALLVTAWLLIPGCAGVPVSGQFGGQTISTRVDAEVARYYLANYLSGRRVDATLDARIDGVYHNATSELPDRDALKRISDEFGMAYNFAGSPATMPHYQKKVNDAQKAGEEWAKYYSATPSPATKVPRPR